MCSLCSLNSPICCSAILLGRVLNAYFLIIIVDVTQICKLFRVPKDIIFVVVVVSLLTLRRRLIFAQKEMRIIFTSLF